MKGNYSEIKNELIHCPYNPNHMVKRCRLVTHKKNCPDKDKRGFVQCPFNPSHYVLIKALEKHKESCPDRVIINQDLANEMEAYIKSLNNSVEKNDENKDKGEIPSGDENVQNDIIGLNVNKKKKRKKKKGKKKKGKQEEKLINLDNIPKKKLIEYIFGEKKSMEYDSDSFTNSIDCEDPK